MVEQDLEVLEESQERPVLVDRDAAREGESDSLRCTKEFVTLHHDQSMHWRREKSQPLHHGPDSAFLGDCHDEPKPLRDLAPHPKGTDGTLHTYNDENWIVGIDVCTEEGILCTPRDLTETAAVVEPLLDAFGLLVVVLLILRPEFLGEQVDDKVGKPLTDVRIYGDAKPQAVFCDELYLWVDRLV